MARASRRADTVGRHITPDTPDDPDTPDQQITAAAPTGAVVIGAAPGRQPTAGSQREPRASPTASRTSVPALRICSAEMISNTPITMSQIPTTRVSVTSELNG